MSSAPPFPAGNAAPRAGDPARQRWLMVLPRPTGTVAWWLDPVLVIVVIMLPLFCFAAYQNRFNYWQFKASANFVTTGTFLLGLYSAGLLLTGIVLGRLLVPAGGERVAVFDGARAERVLMRIGWVTVIAYALLLGTLLAHLGLVLNLLHGDVSAGSDLRDVLGRIPGVTSFIQFGIVYFGLLSALMTLTPFRLTTQLRLMGIAIFVLTFLRAILASERLAILEILAAMAIVPIAYRWRPSLWRSAAPFIGIVFVFIAFAAGEYFRSWQYYKQFYSSYFDFISQRFAGYFSTSINNGAGAYLYYGSKHPDPIMTTGWISQFPGLKTYFVGTGPTPFDDFLEKYATPEFNNPGGLYSAFLDYNFITATVFMLVSGVVIGVLYRRFREGDVTGLILYPMIFFGMTDLIRIFYLTTTRALPIFIGAMIVYYGMGLTRVPRARLTAPRP